MNILPILIILIPYAVTEQRRAITTLKYSKFKIKPTIVNGEAALKGQVPYIISIKLPVSRIGGRTFWTNLCGGSIIGQSKVLTAAHCFDENNFFYVHNSHLLRLVAGNRSNSIIHTGETETTELSQWRKINKLILHNDFHFPMNDIAIVLTDKDWVYTQFVNYVKVSDSNDDYGGMKCISAGYGRIGYKAGDVTSSVLLIALIHIIPKWRCSMLWGLDMDSFICTDSALTDVAMGDSGGPLACHDTLLADYNSKDLLIGVVSGKNFDKTTLYTRVSHYKDWLDSGRASNVFSDIFLIISVVIIYVLF